jgi:hypothetical protein
VLKHCAANRKRRLSALPNVSPYIYTTLKFLALQGAPYICDISRLRVKLVRLTKMGLNETYSRIWVGKHLSDMFPVRNGLKQGDVSLSLLSNFASLFAIKRVQVNQDGLKLNGTHQFLVDADDVNILGRSIYIINKNTKALVVASKEMD